MNQQEIIDYINTAGGGCVGCGFCCLKSKCWVGVRLFKETTPCPALEWNGERHICNLMTGRLGEHYRKELYAGAGCCAGLNSWRREPLKNRIPSKAEEYKNPIPPIMQKFLAALGREFISKDSVWLACNAFRMILIQDGMNRGEAASVASRCFEYITQQRSSKIKEFMG